MSAHKDDFDPAVGPTMRQKWMAFYRLYRAAVKLADDRYLMDPPQNAFGTLFYGSPMAYRWYILAEHGNARYPRVMPEIDTSMPKFLRKMRVIRIRRDRLRKAAQNFQKSHKICF